MLYKIKDNYYIRVGRKYIKVKFEVNGDNVSFTTDNSVNFIEENPNLKVNEQPFDEAFKKKIIDSHKEHPNESNINHRYR